MSKQSHLKTLEGRHSKVSSTDLHMLSHQILNLSMRGFLRIDFLRRIARLILNHTKCDIVEIRLREEGNLPIRCETVRCSKKGFDFKIIQCSFNQEKNILSSEGNKVSLCFYCMMVKELRNTEFPFITKRGSFWSNCYWDLIGSIREKKYRALFGNFVKNRKYNAVAVIPLLAGDEELGVFQIMSRRKDFFSEKTIRTFEDFAEGLGFTLIGQKAQAALQERIKELTCLYGIARTVEKPGVSLDEILKTTVKLLPPAWQYPNITHARIILDGKIYSSQGYEDSNIKQSADIVVNRKKRGVIEVVYSERKYEIDEGPFLKEERSLIDTIARELALIVERRQTEEDKAKLQEQLRHADRLATIGQLAAGVAHELNEPLGNILGFTQLVKKYPNLDSTVRKDIEKIFAASLHAREIVKKLLIFARQMPSRKTKIEFNKVIEEGLYFLKSRCAKEGIELVMSFDPQLPEITADPAQLTQVVVNLVVNAIQSMPDGGRLTIQTKALNHQVILVVEDTGVGMDKKVIRQIFLPFFTTKDIGQGTGLGLSVVHGIVTSHGGSIKVDSEIGKGSRFEIRFPINYKDVEEE